MKKIGAFLLAIAMILSLCACGSSAPAESAATTGDNTATQSAAPAAADDWKGTSLNMTISFPATSPVVPIFEYFCDEIEARSNGKIKIELFLAGALVAANDVHNALVTGSVDIGESDPSYVTAALPLMSGTFMPGIDYHSSKVCSYAMLDLYQNAPWEELQNLKYLFVVGMTSSAFMTNVEIKTYEDFQGKSIRGNGVVVDFIKAIGATPVGISGAEAYEALLKNTIDGVLMPYDVLAQANFGEVLTYGITCPGVSTAHHYVAMNLDKWNSIPAEYQAIIEEVAAECQEKISTVWDELEVEGKEIGAGQGMTFYELDEAEHQKVMDALEPMTQNWIEARNAEGLDGEAAMQLIIETVEKYNEIYG